MTNANAKSPVPDRYAQALNGLDPLEVLRKTPKRLRRLLRDARRTDVEWKPAPEAWSARDVLAHLADGEFILGARLRMIAAHERPALPAYDESLFAAKLGAERACAEDLLAALRGARKANLGLLARLPEEAFGRAGVHAERGEVTLMGLLTTAAGHDRVHEEQIERTLARAAAARRERKRDARAAELAARRAANSPPLRQRKAQPKAAEEAGRAPEPARAPAQRA